MTQFNLINRIMMIAVLGLFTLGIQAQAQVTIVDGHYVDPKQGLEANPTSNPDWSLMNGVIVKKTTNGRRNAPLAPAENYGLPDHVNNGANKYFRRPVANQAGNSCGITSRHSHMMAYELNAYRDKDGSMAENMLPAHFAFVPAYNEDPNKEDYAKYVGVPDGATFSGTNYSSIYGGPYTETSNNYGRMQGYENWHKAMFNRITDNPNFPLGAMTEDGALAWKRWLYNHNGDEGFHAGGVIGVGLASSGCDNQAIASTTANDAAGVTGLKYLTHWGTGVDHAMTVVGYDDRIEFDLDGDGTYGSASNHFGQNETGAWIVANSWGNWCNNGFIYVPYALGSPTSTTVTSGSYSGYKAGDVNGWTGEVYKIRKNYVPIRTLKAAVAYSKRSEIQICVGISTNLNASSPDKTLVLKNHNYHGDYNHGDGPNDTDVDADVPMLGRWADGILHTEAMEFGYDLTDFTDEFDRHRPLKYFLIINTKSGASGSGKIEYASIMDYELNANGVETPFASKNVNITNNGGTTTISTIVYGEEVYGPDNLALSSTTLSWDAPQGSNFTPTGYNIYQNGSRIGTTTSRSYDIGSATGVFYVTASLYNVNGATSESPVSNLVLRDMSSSSFISYIGNPITDVSQLTSNMYVMLYNYGRSKYMYDNGASTIYLFTNGEPTVLDPDYYKYVFKVTKSNNKYTFTSINGNIPAISSNNQTLTPSNSAGSYTVSKVSESDNLFTLYSSTYLNGNDNNPVGWSSGTDNTSKWILTPVNVSIPNENTLNVTIADPGTVYTGAPVQLSLEGAVDIASATWNVAGTNYTGVSPVVTFSGTGSKSVSCTATDSKGNSKSTSKNITVSAAPTATANFSLSSASTTGSDRISFISQNTLPGCTYSWSMPGAEETTATTRNASATYLSTGQKTVTLTVTDGNSNTYTHSETFMVNASAPKSRYTISPAIVVKNNPVTLTDNSLYNPTYWNWSLESDNDCIRFNEQNGTITPTKAGVYKLSLLTGNDLGTDFVEAERALIVCNSNSYQGLTFGGGNQNVTATLPSALTTAWTIDFWFNPASLGTTTQRIMGSNSSDFSITSNENGVATLAVGSESVSTDNTFYISNEWHHYAVTFNSGTVTFYRDGNVVSTKTASTTNFSSYFKNLQLGGSAAPLSGSIDEFRVWNKALSLENIRSYCVAPISASTSGLQLYWQMNQNSGDVSDATSNNISGTRNNFGPDGDAWTDSNGVFALDFSTNNGDLKSPDLNSYANDIETGTWYVMYNRGRKGYAYENANVVYNSADAGLVGATAKYLVRLFDAGNGKYYIKNGLGNYFQALSTSNSTPVTTGAAKEKFTIAKINSTDGHFYVQGSNNVVLDCNATGDAVVSYGTIAPTSTGSNNDWAFYPVEIVEHFAPTATDIYTINNLNASRGALMSAPSQSVKWVWDHNKNSQTFDATNTNFQWIFVPTSEPNQYCLYNVGKQKFIAPTKSGSYGGYSWMFSSDAVPLQLYLQSDGTYKISSVSGNIYLSVSNSYTGPIINYNDVGAQFTLTKQADASSAVSTQLNQALTAIPLANKPMSLNAVGDKSYATLYLDYDTQTDTNTKAYYITETTAGYAILTEVANEGRDIPAYTAVVLINDEATTSPTFSTGFSISNGYAEAVTESTNLLKGTLTSMTLDLSDGTNNYSLGRKNGVIGFYKFDNNGTYTITLGANKAYLEVPGSGVKGFMFDFDEEATSVNEVLRMKNEELGTSIYNLSGQRLSKPQHGVNIINGKKVFIK